MNRSVIAPLLAAVALAACATSQGPTGLTPRTTLSRYVLEVEPGVDRIALAVHDEGAVSANQRAALAELVRRFATEQAEVIRVEGPSGGDPVAAQTAWAVRDALTGLGVPSERVLVVGYDAPAPRAPVLAGFETLHARIPDCATTASVPMVSWSNQPPSGFGCAVTANLAAQIADPRDIQQPRAMTPADASRRTVVFDQYRAGKQTSAEAETLIRETAVSRAVN